MNQNPRIVEFAKRYAAYMIGHGQDVHSMALAETADQSGVMLVPIHATFPTADLDMIHAWNVTALALAKVWAGDGSRAVAVMSMGMAGESVSGEIQDVNQDVLVDPDAVPCVIIACAAQGFRTTSWQAMLAMDDDGTYRQTSPGWHRQDASPWEASCVEPILVASYGEMERAQIKTAAQIIGLDAIFEMPYTAVERG